MNSDCLVNKIVAAFRKLEKEILQRDPGDRPQNDEHWTKEVLITFCNLGEELGYDSAPNRDRDRGEFLYDASWRKSDNCGRIISIPMVAESEWSGRENIVYDFQKLLIARAKVRVMVYDAGVANGEGKNLCLLKRLPELVGAFNGTEGDTYLLIPYLSVRGKKGEFKFKFHQITDKGPCNPPELKPL